MKRMIGLTVIVVGGLLLLQVSLGQKPDRRNFEYSPDMARTAAYKAQSFNPFLPRHQTSQPPVAGTIPRGLRPLHYGRSEAEAQRAGRELTAPFGEANPADLKRGRKVFEIYCQPCHGAGGRGDGPVAQRGYPPPPSLLLDHAKQMKDGQVFYIITYGFKNMPAYGAQIDRLDRWQVVEYVRKLQETQP